MTCRTVTMKAGADRRYIRTTYRSNRFVRAEIRAPHAHPEEGRQRPAVNLSFVIDRSGSMAGEKLRLVKQAVTESIARLRPDDRFSIVAYDDQVELIAASTLATAEARADAVRRLARVAVNGTTNLGEGWLRGCAEVAQHLVSDGVNRCLLLTDGLANVGITDRDELVTHAGALRKRGVTTSTFGVGEGFDDVLLEGMSTAGAGNFYFIGSEAQIVDLVTSEVGEALDVVARDVTLEVVAPGDVVVEALSGYPFEMRGGRLIVALGALVAEQVVEVVLRLRFPYGDAGADTGVMLSLGDSDASSSVALSWVYADGKVNDAQPRDVEVDRAVARVFAARARQEATRLNRSGDYEAANATVAAVARRIRSYAGKDSELCTLVEELTISAATFRAPMKELDRKAVWAQATMTTKFRNPEGKAFRGS